MTLRQILRSALCLCILPISGCVTKPSADSDVLSETDEQRSTRRIFKDDWLRPSVTQEDYDFFYKNFFWGGR
jgi:hypothetical protein